MKKISIILCLFTLGVFMGYVSIASAQQASEARSTLEKAIDQITPILIKPEFKAKATRQPHVDQIEKIIFTVFDFNEFSSRTVGAKWRTFTAAQQQEFQNAFSELLYQTYLGSLLNYSGQKVSFINELKSSAGDKVEVQTTIPNNNKTIPVNYRMIKKPEGWRVYDVIVENVGMVQNYRNQFQEVLGKESPETLIEMIKTKAQEAKAKNDAVNL